MYDDLFVIYENNLNSDKQKSINNITQKSSLQYPKFDFINQALNNSINNNTQESPFVLYLEPSYKTNEVNSFDNFNFVSNELNEDLKFIDIEDLLKQEGITSVNGKSIKFGDRNLRTWGKETSNHRKKDPHTGYASARDISIVGGTIKDYEDLKNILINNITVRNWMTVKGWGIINEVTPEILSQTKGTGKHFHFGPDSWAKNTWSAWINNPTFSVRQSFKNYTNSNSFNSNQQFAISLNNTYRKALISKGLNPDYSYILTAQDANESGWGKNVKGNYNYGNITTSGNDWHVKSKKYGKWKDFSSLEDYVNYKINYLSGRRYDFFNLYKPGDNVAASMQRLANQGYAPDNNRYGINVANTYNTLLKYLNGNNNQR